MIVLLSKNEADCLGSQHRQGRDLYWLRGLRGGLPRERFIPKIGCSRLHLPSGSDAQVRNAVTRLTVVNAGQQTFDVRAQLAVKPSAGEVN